MRNGTHSTTRFWRGVAGQCGRAVNSGIMCIQMREPARLAGLALRRTCSELCASIEIGDGSTSTVDLGPPPVRRADDRTGCD